MRVRLKEIKEAIQWTGKNEDQLAEFIKRTHYVDHAQKLFKVPIKGTLEPVEVGGWVVRNDEGIVEVCEEVEFNKKFEFLDNG